MRLTDLRPLYQHPGPWASAYADVGGDAEDARQAIPLRARSAREQLLEQGADQATADAVHDAIAELRGSPGRRGVAVFAAGGRVVHSELLSEPPAATRADWAPEPHVMPLLVQRGEQIPHLLVAVDRTGADFTVWSADPGSREAPQDAEELQGRTDPIRKGNFGGWSQPRYQRRAENTWDRNAREVAAEAAALAERFAVEAILVAGDVRAVALLREHLPVRWQGCVTELDTGGRADGTSPAHLEAARRAAIAERAARQRAASAERFTQEVGRHRLAVEGVGPVVNALSEGKVLTVLLEDRPESEARLWVGPEPHQLALFVEDARLLGAEQPVQDRADAAIARALVGTAGDLVALQPEDGAKPADGIGALLRHE